MTVIVESHVAHLRDAVAAATLETDPRAAYGHPEPTAARHVRTAPGHDAAARRLRYRRQREGELRSRKTTIAPERSRETWLWFQRDVVDGVLTPMLSIASSRTWSKPTAIYSVPTLSDDALRLPKHAFRGRLMLRRPGYRLKPHRDMRIAALTGLIYFARPGDSAQYGSPTVPDRQRPAGADDEDVLP